MKKILIALELGGNYGHLAHGLCLAEVLASQYAITFAVADLQAASPLLRCRGFQGVASPLAQPSAKPAHAPINYADMLLGEGFADSSQLAERLRRWQQIFEQQAIDCIVADHAPSALFAAHLAGMPALPIGSGFCLPPAQDTLPSIRPWENIPHAALAAVDKQLRQNMAEAGKRLGIRREVSLADLFPADSIVSTFAELDHYPARPHAVYGGPLYMLPNTKKIDWQGLAEKRVLAYLRPSHPAFMRMIEILAACGAEVIAHAPGLRPGQRRCLSVGKVQLSTEPFDLETLLPSADLMVSHGSSGVVAQSLRHGVPQLMLAEYVEQYMFALRVAAWQGGRALGFDLSPACLRANLHAVLNDEAYRSAAQAFAERHAGDAAGDAAHHLARRITEQHPP